MKKATTTVSSVLMLALSAASLSACAQSDQELCNKIGSHVIRLNVADRAPAYSDKETIEQEIARAQNRSLPGFVQKCLQKGLAKHSQYSQCLLQSKNSNELETCDRRYMRDLTSRR